MNSRDMDRAYTEGYMKAEKKLQEAATRIGKLDVFLEIYEEATMGMKEEVCE